MMTLDFELTTEQEKMIIEELNARFAGVSSPITAINAVRVEVLTEAEREVAA